MSILLLIKGIIVGVAKIIPGLSGAVLMISFDLYDKAIYSITNFFSDVKKNFIFLFNLGVGVVLGIVFFSKIINFFINHYYLYTTFLFVGLILGGIPVINKKINYSGKNIIIVVASFILMIIFSLSNLNNTYVIKNNFFDIFVFFGAGLLEAVGTILPGVSSTALLMLIGIYNMYIESISSILNINYIFDSIIFLLPFTFGLFIGCVFLSLLVNYLFNKYRDSTFSFVLGMSFSTIVLLVLKNISLINNLSNFFISFMVLVFGYFITSRL